MVSKVKKIEDVIQRLSYSIVWRVSFTLRESARYFIPSGPISRAPILIKIIKIISKILEVCQ